MMRSFGIVMLALISLALAGTVGLELRAGRTIKSAPVATHATRPANVAGAPVRAGDDQAWLGPILGRPIFSPSRRPTVDRVASQAAKPPPSLPRLAGIVMDGSRRSVIFAANGDRHPVTVAEGAVFDGFRIEAIEPGRVTVSGVAGRQILHPSFDPNQPAAAPIVPAAATATPAQGGSFNGPPGLSAMPKPAIAPPPGGPSGIAGLPRMNGLGGIPGLPGPPPGR